MRVLLVQKTPKYRFMADFCAAFEAEGHNAELLGAEEFGQLADRVQLLRPDFIFTVGAHPSLSYAVSGAVPVVHYELDQLMSSALYAARPPAPNEVVCTAYAEDLATFRAIGFQQVHYLPFCVDCQRHLSRDSHRYGATFVGTSVHGDANDYTWYKESVVETLKDNVAALELFKAVVLDLDAILAEQEQASLVGLYVLPGLVRDRMVGAKGERLRLFRLTESRAVNVLAKEAASRQRALLLQQLTELTVFGDAGWKDVMPNARYGGPIDPYTGSSALFAQSRININIQRIYARTGLSDRVFNVLDAGGFLLADRNEALLELFDDEADVATFAGPEELCDKAAFYLVHETERERIARRGHERVAKEHQFRNRVRPICEAAAAVI